MIITETLDVTQIEPRLKHPTIFEHFDALKPGESFVIHNDHDPKPLYYQLLGERGAIFTWEYLEEGPRTWLVKIAKNKINEEKNVETVGSIAAKDYRKAEVFKKLGIDFCCGGEKSLKDASKEAGISEEQLRQELEDADTVTVSASQDYNKWKLDFLADFIANTHHQYIRDNATVILGLADKVAQRHGPQHPELGSLAERVNTLMNDLLSHIEKEEKVLFPAIKSLVLNQNDSSASQASIKSIIDNMHVEHDHAGDDLKYLRKLTNGYTLPADACNSYNYLFEKLKEFEDDLFKHIHLENNILFPKVVALETK
ncbi:iron-sulfur cluster repair di-iron protein [Albibacterium bauzanense]|uniref:Regulator of cell morphogenesis and NO signaling n=1 Tax=Albibacterium bauzanense TaxID=653929 RepID=A0A4V2PXQ7_9SPHI|nr:iron-sulfur cluster repair di-iron protein [Albibacterium bauzanense]TCK83031.1 regulator of cell morphogenesis and NO signaling [Albibacterium bauzanense]